MKTAKSAKTKIEVSPKRNLPRDVFLHLLAIVTLYWSAVSFVTLMWQYINYFFPDILNYYPGSFNGPMRFAIASLIIVFPIFILVSWYLNKIYRKEAAVRESKIRKWLIYLTLFITSLIIIGDLVATINAFLGGEITKVFILKALSVLLVAAIIFGYYLDDVRRNDPTKLAKYFAGVAGIIILVSVIGAFFIVGSPATARLMQFDQQKMSDLMGIQSAILNYWQSKGKMPNALSDLNDSISGYGAPTDPQTGVPYEYALKDASTLTFELCATFNKEGKSNPGFAEPVPVSKNLYSQNWDHPAGRTCFERTIDRQFYPILNKVK